MPTLIKLRRYCKRAGFAVAVALLLVVVVAPSIAQNVVLAADAKTSTTTQTKTNTAADTKNDSKTVTNDSNSNTQTQEAVESHSADSQLQVGTLVQLADKDSTVKVTPASYDKPSQMYGLVIDPSRLTFTVASGNLPNELYVATGGTHDMLVSTQNGVIEAGDYVTISAINGVGMKALPEQKTVFGRAVDNFDGKSNVLGTAQLKDTSGKSSAKVAIGKIQVTIDIRHNPDEKSTKANVPSVLQRIGEAVAEKPVGPLRIYLSILITGICVVAAIVLLYAGVRNAIISIGRNPLSKKAIFRALMEVILTALIVLITGLFAVYLLLKL